MRLREREMLVLYSMTACPDHRISSICDHLGMKESTYVTMKKKLISTGLVRQHRTAHPLLFGLRVRGYENGFLKPGMDIGAAKEFINRIEMDYPYSIDFSTDGLTYQYEAMANSFTSLKRLMDELKLGCESCDSYWPPKKDRSMIAISETRINNVDDHSGLISFWFDIPKGDLPKRRHGADPDGPEIEPIMNNSKDIVDHLLQEPLLSDGDIALMTGCSRQKVGKVRLDLERSGMLIRSYRPDLWNLGFRIASHLIIGYRRNSEKEDILAFEKDLYERILPLKWSSSEGRSDLEYYFPSLADFKKFKGHLLGMSSSNVVESIKPVLFSIPSGNIIRYGEGYA